MTSLPGELPFRLWRPKFFECLRGYRKEDLSRDLIAGVTVGLVALPLAMAFGIASGVTPQAGIYTAIVGGLIVSLLGGSKIQVAGPTGAFVVIVSAIIAQHGLSGLLVVTMMAGVIMLGLGLSGLGAAVRYIPRPVVIGFTNGIALLIATTQIKDFLGVNLPGDPTEFFARLRALAENIGRTDIPTVTLASVSLAEILLPPRWLPRGPGSIPAPVLGTAAAALLDLPVETIGTKFGGIPQGLPVFDVPEFRPSLILPLLPAALTVALLASVESLLSAVVADSMTGDRHNSNVELAAQGLANIVSPIVGGIPVTGAIARTATNFRSGARTPVAGVVHALTLLVVILAAAPLAKYIPLATLAAVGGFFLGRGLFTRAGGRAAAAHGGLRAPLGRAACPCAGQSRHRTRLDRAWQ